VSIIEELFVDQSIGRMKKRIIIAGVLVLVAAAALFLLYSNRGEARILATVNEEAITVEKFMKEADKLEESNRDMVMENPSMLMDLLIMKALLLQEAEDRGFEKVKDEDEDEFIGRFMESRFSTPPEIDKEEVMKLYEAFKENFVDMSLEEAVPMIEQWLHQVKQQEAHTRFMEELRNKAEVEIHYDHLQAIATEPSGSTDGTNTREEFDTALKSGRPVLVDFGSDSCLPCRKLRPILEEIKKEKDGQVEVLVIDVYKHQGLAREYQIRTIPTLVYFDAEGKEAHRTQGFIPKAALLEDLSKIGVV
jgi:thioredoxin 1